VRAILAKQLSYDGEQLCLTARRRRFYYAAAAIRDRLRFLTIGAGQ